MRRPCVGLPTVSTDERARAPEETAGRRWLFPSALIHELDPDAGASGRRPRRTARDRGGRLLPLPAGRAHRSAERGHPAARGPPARLRRPRPGAGRARLRRGVGCGAAGRSGSPWRWCRSPSCRTPQAARAWSPCSRSPCTGPSGTSPGRPGRPWRCSRCSSGCAPTPTCLRLGGRRGRTAHRRDGRLGHVRTLQAPARPEPARPRPARRGRGAAAGRAGATAGPRGHRPRDHDVLAHRLTLLRRARGRPGVPAGRAPRGGRAGRRGDPGRAPTRPCRTCGRSSCAAGRRDRGAVRRASPADPGRGGRPRRRVPRGRHEGHPRPPGGRPGRRARLRRPHRLPHRPGGPDQRPQGTPPGTQVTVRLAGTPATP